ncbi:MAG TPA: hypothetical protein VMM78_12685 [Thermomicrobiales bacterium]|nr:hypothetical protein [Thermomicrobiales bacterium]
MFYSIGRPAYRYLPFVIAFWLVCLALSAPLIPRLPQVLAVSGFSNQVIEAPWARALLEESLPASAPSTLVVIFQSEALPATDPRCIKHANIALAGVVALPEVIGVNHFGATASFERTARISI